MKLAYFFAITAFLGSSFAVKADHHRLVVSTKVTNDINSASALNSQFDDIYSATHCFTLAQGQQWCVPFVRQSDKGAMHLGAAEVNGTKAYSLALKVPAFLTLLEAKQLLQNSNLYDYVELDVEITSYGWNLPTPNDTEFSRQMNYFGDNSSDLPVASSILSMWAKLKNPTKKGELYVMDGGFREHSDMTFQSGFNFTVVSFDSERRPGFYESEFNAECTSDHGIQVASTAAATINNNSGMTGVVNDVNVTPIRVLNCRNGFLSDVSAALDWLSGDDAYLRSQSPAIPVFNGKAGVINMSLGGNVGGNCPFYLQNAINKVLAKGFSIVAAAGNENDDVANYSPANCDGVITVGATNLGTAIQQADKASFSNYGNKVDIMAQGQSIIGAAKDNQLVFWSGTSAAAPLVSGIIAAVLKDFSLTPEEQLLLVQISGNARWHKDSYCINGLCGGGVLDAAKLYDNAQRLQEGSLNTISYTLNKVDLA